MEYKRLTDDELADFLQRACVQLVPELTQQLLSLGAELAEYRTKIACGTLVDLPCKVCDLVWVIKEYPFGKRKIEGVEIVGFIWPTIDSKPWPADRFGDAYSEVFHKYEDVKKRLKELQNEKD